MFTIIALAIPASAVIAHSISKRMLINSVKKSMYALADVYEVRLKQRTMLGDLASDYFNSISLDGHRALSELDKLLLQVEDVIRFSQMAIDSSSKRFLKEAKKRISKFHKEMEDSLDTITETMDQSQVRKLKATWEYKAQELVDLVSQQISDSSAKCKNLGYRVPNGRTIRKPTDMALHEIRNLLPQD